MRNWIDITQTPFSAQGSRLLLYRYPKQDALYLKFAERHKNSQIGLEDFLHRPPYIRSLSFIDEVGNPLTYHLTTYPHALSFQTQLGTFVLAFHNTGTLAFGLPPGVRAGIRMHMIIQAWEKTVVGGILKNMHDVEYRTNGRVLRNEIVSGQEESNLEFLVEAGSDTAIHLVISSDLGIDDGVSPFSQTLRVAEKRWHEWFDNAPQVRDDLQIKYYYAWWVMGNNLVAPLGNVMYEAMMPSKAKYIGIWNWDACFHAVAFRHVDPKLARDQLRTMLAHQLPNGMVPDAVYDAGVIDHLDHPIKGEVTKPPVIAWAALKIHETDPNIEFLGEIYPSLVRWNSWWFLMNDDDADGLVQYNHPYSSGLDDSPLWDHGLPVASPDINTYLCIQMDALAVVAEALDKFGEANIWRQRARNVAQRMVRDLYDPEAGLFWAMHDHKPIPEVTLLNLFPLWTGRLPKVMQENILAHLINPDEFWTNYPLSTVARNSSSYDPDTMWRGPTWVNMNYIFIEALTKVGLRDLANELRDRTLDLIAQHSGIYEFYNSETGEPGSYAAPIFGWTAALFIDLVQQISREQINL
jgi:hypothetical protein